MKIKFRKGSWAILPAVIVSFVSIFVSYAKADASYTPIPNAGFEDNTFTGWSKGTQTGTLGSSITGNGSGVTIFSGSRTFSHGSHPAMGNPSSPYYAPAVSAGSWTFSPKNASYAVLLQPKGQQTYNQAIAELGLSNAEKSEIQNILTSQAAASGFGGGNPTDAAWITREVELNAGDVYTMAWNYVGTDYVPFNDGSITSLVPVSVNGTPVITVNNYVKSYALLGFTNPGTGDYSTNSYGATGWQTSTYEVSISGTYKLGFTSFNLDDQGLPPALMVDSESGSTLSCTQSGTCTTFGGVEPNNETAPTLPPTTTTEATTTTTSTTTTTVPETTTTSTTTTTTSTTSTVPESTSTTEAEVTTTTTTVLINTTEPPTTTTEVINPPETLPEPPVEVFPQPTPDVIPDPEPIVEEIPADTTSSIPEETSTTTSEPEVVTTIPEEVTTTTEPVDTTPEEVTPEEVIAIVEEITNASIEEVVAILSELSTEEVTAVLENISVEQLTEVLNDLPVEEVVNLIESIDSADALENIVDAISEEAIDPDTAIAVIANGSFEEIPIDKITEVFAAIEPEQFTEEQKSELAAVLTEAPTEIKEAFEEEIDIYGDGFDDYTPTGSTIDVGTRKTVLAAAAAMATSAALTPTAPSGGTSGGSSGPSGGSSGGTEGRSRREEEGEDGFSGEIAGPGEDDDEDFTKNSIYNYYIKEGKEMKKFSWFGFSKKVWDITAGLGFTLAGSLVVYVTLSGVTQKIAGIATLTAILVHYVHEILKNDK